MDIDILFWDRRFWVSMLKRLVNTKREIVNEDILILQTRHPAYPKKDAPESTAWLLTSGLRCEAPPKSQPKWKGLSEELECQQELYARLIALGADPEAYVLFTLYSVV